MADKNFTSELFEWIKTLPYWKQYLSATIFTEKAVSDLTVENSFQFFLQEHALSEENTALEKIDIEEILNENIVVDNIDIKEMHLLRISDFKNISAIKDGQKIELDPQLTVLFGENGAGKTSYIRLLNNAFQSRGEKEMLPNIYKDGEYQPPSCVFEFKYSDEVLSYQYPDQKEEREFSIFTVFDSKSFRIHIDSKNELLFHPKDFDFFYLLIEGLHKVDLKLQEAITLKTRENPFSARFYSDVESEVKQFITNLSANSDINLLDELSYFSADDEIRKRNLEKERARLISQEVDKKIKEEEALLSSINSFQSDINDIFNVISVESIQDANISINNLIDKKNLIEQSSSNQLKKLNIEISGSEQWRNFIESAFNFSRAFFSEYPNTEDGTCIFCNQPLSIEAKQLISSYWEYLSSVIEDDYKRALQILEAKMSSFKSLKFNQLEDSSYLFQKLRLDKHEEITVNLWKENLHKLETYCDYVIDKMTKNEAIELSAPLAEFKNIESILSFTQKRIKDLKEEDPAEAIEKHTNEITFLSHKQILSGILEEVKIFLNDLKWIDKASKKNYEFNTSSITRKQRQLFETYVSGNYLNSFKEECKKLNAEFNVEISQEGKKGNTLRELKIKGHSLRQVLSEGEQRAISLADFLTEINLGNESKGIILDDPVNSLDHKRKRIIAERFVEEATKRQVIIFTHDLMFVSYLKVASKAMSIGFSCHWVQKMLDGAGQVYLNNSPANESDYKNANVARECHRKSKLAEPQEQEHILKQGFGALRTNYEAFVIFELFGDVVQRFNERISIERLKDVVIDDEIVNAVIEKTGFLSRYIEGHLHSDSFVFEKPTPELLLAEIDAFESIKRKQKGLKAAKTSKA